MANPLSSLSGKNGTSGNRANSLLTKGRSGLAELTLAFVVLSVVAMMIVPLPTWLLDGLLALNLSAAVAILLTVLYVPDALSIATFPTLLLITTLFRLGLNVSSARLILLQANAGEVIAAFGNFVVRGNYVVGGVIFLILTIIQFVVITKGSERVAEVSARFVLDAMPGKQMAIDAELRSGTIDGLEARKRRHKLSRESQFYGAMDGAMKFVKGDVIASLIITVVNIFGGLAIGMAQKGMPAAIALKKYGLLTIGDGLVSQVPALVLSTAAGILVTRTASEEPDTPLGSELAGQLFAAPKALRLSALFIMALGLIPGLPTLPFGVIGVALFFVARARDKTLRVDAERAAVEPRQATQLTKAGEHFIPVLVPWSLDVAEDLEPLISRTSDDENPNIAVAVARLRTRLFVELGVPLPAGRVRVTKGLPSRHVALTIFEVPTRIFEVNGSVADADIGTTIGNRSYDELRTRAADFLGMHETQRLLDELEQFAPALVRNVVPKPVTVMLLADILRRLVEEGISIRDLRGILEALALVASSEKDPLPLTEFVRGQFKRATTYRLTEGGGSLSVITLDPIVEDTMRRAITRTPQGSFLSLAPQAARDVVTSIRRAVAESESENPVILAAPDIRRFVRKLIEIDLPNVQVVSFAELLPEVTIRPLAKAHLGGLG